MNKETLLGKSLAELQEIVRRMAEPSFRAKQIAEWMYQKQATSFEEMTNLPKTLREKLGLFYTIGRSTPVAQERSADGTEKYLFTPLDKEGLYFETVYIPDGERATLCVSSQVGCKMNCSFCATGKMGFQAQLTSGDILNQVLSIPHSEELTNIVFMGMGEPLDNYEAVRTAIEILTSDYGLGWSPKRITVSSVGIRAGLKRLLKETKVHIAISLHNPYPAERLEMMPAEKAFPITDLLKILQEEDFSGQRRLSFEYIVFGGLNDTQQHADKLIQLLRPLDCRVNLIRYHRVLGLAYHSTSESQILWLNEYLNHHGLRSTIRRSRGEDISAACGMLAVEEGGR